MSEYAFLFPFSIHIYWYMYTAGTAAENRKFMSKETPFLYLNFKVIGDNMHTHGEEHVKKLFSTAVIVNEDTHWTFVRGH